MPRQITQCPVCDASLRVTELSCAVCATRLKGDFPPAPLAGLSAEHQRFVETFVRCRGIIRDVERALGVSYPTVRARLDAAVAALEVVLREEPQVAVADVAAPQESAAREEAEGAAARAAEAGRGGGIVGGGGCRLAAKRITRSTKMPNEENLLVLKMLQDGTISADQASELLQALTTAETRAAAAAPAVPVAPAAPAAPLAPHAVLVDDEPALPGMEPENDAFARARVRIAAARERVAGVQEKLSEAEERLEAAATGESPQRWHQVADTLRDLPAARSVAEALRSIEPGRIAANARRRARRMARTVRSSVGDFDLNLGRGFSNTPPGEPTLSAPREATTSLSTGGTLRVKNTLGAIEVQGADVPEARIAGVLKIWAADEPTAQALADAISIVVEPGADGPTVRVQHPERIRKVILDLKVFLPAQGARVSLLSLTGDLIARGLGTGAAIVLATQSGDARATEVGGDVAVETASGEIIIEGIQGNVTASSASGDITAIRVTGQTMRASTQSGDITLSESGVATVDVKTVSGQGVVRNVAGRSLRMSAVSGDARAEGCAFEEAHLDAVSGYLAAVPHSPLTGGILSLETISGDTDLRLPAECAGVMDVTTKSGDVDARFLDGAGVEKTIRVAGMTHLNEILGAGGSGVKVTLSTISGDLTITQDSSVIEIS